MVGVGGRRRRPPPCLLHYVGRVHICASHKQSSSTANNVSVLCLTLCSAHCMWFVFLLFFPLFVCCVFFTVENRIRKREKIVFQRRWRRQRGKNLLNYAPFCLHTKSIRHKIQSAMARSLSLAVCDGIGALCASKRFTTKIFSFKIECAAS